MIVETHIPVPRLRNLWCGLKGSGTGLVLIQKNPIKTGSLQCADIKLFGQASSPALHLEMCWGSPSARILQNKGNKYSGTYQPLQSEPFSLQIAPSSWLEVLQETIIRVLGTGPMQCLKSLFRCPKTLPGRVQKGSGKACKNIVDGKIKTLLQY